MLVVQILLFKCCVPELSRVTFDSTHFLHLFAMKPESNKTNNKLNIKQIQSQLKTENDFITDLFNLLPIPASAMKGKCANLNKTLKLFIVFLRL